MPNIALSSTLGGKGWRAAQVVAKAGLEPSEIQLFINEPVKRMLECARKQLGLQIQSSEPRTGISVFESSPGARAIPGWEGFAFDMAKAKLFDPIRGKFNLFVACWRAQH